MKETGDRREPEVPRGFRLRKMGSHNEQSEEVIYLEESSADE